MKTLTEMLDWRNEQLQLADLPEGKRGYLTGESRALERAILSLLREREADPHRTKDKNEGASYGRYNGLLSQLSKDVNKHDHQEETNEASNC